MPPTYLLFLWFWITVFYFDAVFEKVKKEKGGNKSNQKTQSQK